MLEEQQWRLAQVTQHRDTLILACGHLFLSVTGITGLKEKDIVFDNLSESYSPFLQETHALLKAEKNKCIRVGRI